MRTWRRKYYDRFSRVYDRFVALHSSDRQGSLRGFLAEQVAAATGRTILDRCTGTGALLIELHSRIGGGLIVGLDFSAGMLSVARQKTRHCPELALVQAEADRLPFKSLLFYDGTRVPRNRIVRLLFYIRLLSMGARQALRILKYERRFLARYFSAPEKVVTPSGKSKVWICRNERYDYSRWRQEKRG